MNPDGMCITAEQSAIIYARFLVTRFGMESTKLVEKRLEQLDGLHDETGQHVWKLVYENVCDIICSTEKGALFD